MRRRLLGALLCAALGACTDYSKMTLVDVRKPGDMDLTCDQLLAEVDATDAEIDRMAPAVTADSYDRVLNPLRALEISPKELQVNWLGLHKRNRRLIRIALNTKRCEPVAYWLRRSIEAERGPAAGMAS